MPGFINLKLSGAYLRDYLREMQAAPHFGLEPEAVPRKVVMDYGGPNVAKPLHVGHLRSAIIGESLKRIYRYFGNDVTGDIHMGDWGLQMGLIIAELRCRQPERRILTRASPGTTRQRPPSPSLSWRKSIPPPRPRASRMRPLPPKPMRRRRSCSRATGAAGLCGRT